MSGALLELYSRMIWPFVRNFVSKSRRCRKCIVSEKFTLLKDGLCPECQDLSLKNSAGSIEVSAETRRRFDQTINAYISGKRYHAVMLLSGGKDSAYILDRLRREYPQLRILCVLVNNGFMSPVAVDNAKAVAAKLKTDLLIRNACIDEFAAVFRKAFLELNGRGSYSVVDFADGELIFRIGRKVAEEMDIPLLFGGLSWVQVQRIVGQDDFQLVQPPGPLIVFPLAVWRTDEQEIRQIVRDARLLPPRTDSPIVSNSRMILPMMVVDMKNNGYCSFEPEFAQLVREGKSSRRLWLYFFECLEYAASQGWLDREVNGALSALGLSLKDVVKEKVCQ